MNVENEKVGFVSVWFQRDMLCWWYGYLPLFSPLSSIQFNVGRLAFGATFKKKSDLRNLFPPFAAAINALKLPRKCSLVIARFLEKY